MNNEEIIARIEKTEKIIKNGIGNDIKTYLQVLDMLRNDYESVKDKNKAVKIAKEIIKIIDEGDKSKLRGSEISDITRNSYDTLARNGDFEAFMIAMEWNRPLKNQFYLPRRRVLKKHGFIQAIQDLLDRRIKMLVLEAPPGIGKSVLRRICVLLSVCNESI